MNDKYWIAELQDLHDQIDRDVTKHMKPYGVSRVLRINGRIKEIIEGMKG